jgi:hypothetical protein
VVARRCAKRCLLPLAPLPNVRVSLFSHMSMKPSLKVSVELGY